MLASTQSQILGCAYVWVDICNSSSSSSPKPLTLSFSLSVSLFRSVSFNMCLSFLYLCLSLASEFARRTTPSRLWDGYLPHKQLHIDDSGLLQLSSLSSKPALCLCLSVRPSGRVCLSVCLSSSVRFSVSLSIHDSLLFLSLFWSILGNFATTLKISFWSVWASLCLSLLVSVFLWVSLFWIYYAIFCNLLWRFGRGPNKSDGHPRLPNKLASSIVDQGTRIVRQEEEKSREAKLGTQCALVLQLATLLLLLPLIDKLLQLLAMKRNATVFTYVKEKPWVPPKNHPQRWWAVIRNQNGRLMVIRGFPRLPNHVYYYI